MSVVTGVVLFLSVLSEEEINGALKAVNEIAGRGGFRPVDEFAGGTKHPEFEIWAAGFNYLDEREMVAGLKSIDWKSHGVEWVQMCKSNFIGD